MNIVTAQLVLSVDVTKAKADVFLNPIGHVICHLTEGFDSSTFPNGQSDAVIGAAHVPVFPAPGESVTSWTFGFVQVARYRSPELHGAFYAGRIPREGSIAVRPGVPPALADNVLYDAKGSPPDPWFQAPATSFIAPKVNAAWGDHPAIKIPTRLRNSGRNVDNFLFQLIDDREFWTIFTAVDPAGKITYIAHSHWQVRHEIELMWFNESDKLRRKKSSVSVLEAKVPGAPTVSELQGILACLWRIDTVAVKRSDPRNVLQPRTQTPDDFIPGSCRG